MSDASWLLTTLTRTTLWLAAAGLVAAIVLRWVRPAAPTVHRAVWLLVLLAGWTFLRLPVSVPWYDAPRQTPAAVASPEMDDVTPAELTPAELISAAPAPTEPAEFLELKPTASQPVDWQPSAPEPAVLPLATVDPPVAAKPSSAAWRIDWPRTAIVVWATGMASLSLAWLVGYMRFVRRLRDRRPAEGDWLAEWSRLTAAAGIRRTIPLCMSDRFGPLLCRLPRGYELIVPEPLWRELDGAGRQAILRHELAHYLRGDVWKSLAARTLVLPHWFNPVGWLALRRFDEAAEWACDRAATGDSPATEYAKVLVQLGQQPHSFGYGSAARGNFLAARVRRVLAGPTQEDSTMKKAFLLTAAICLVAVSAVQLDLVAQQPTASDQQSADASAAHASAKKASDSDQPAASEVFPPGPRRQTVEFFVGDAKLPTDAEKKMVEEAERAFQTTQAALEAEVVKLEPLLDWSLRWLQAAQAVATDDAARIAAAKDHVQRMHNIQRKAQLLYDVGTRGGEAKDLAAANYYLTDAQHRLTLAQAATKSADRRSRTIPESTNDRQAGVQTELLTIDLKIKIAELRGELAQTKAMYEGAKGTETVARAAARTNSISQVEMTKLLTETRRLSAQYKTLDRQLQLQMEKLKLIESLRQPAKKPNGHAATTKTAPARKPGDPNVKPVLLYDGRDFDAWADDLRTDLSPERRTEAIHALATFAAHGYGRAAAEAIMDVMKDYSVRLSGSHAELQFSSAAQDAFQRPASGNGRRGIPPEDALPVVIAGLESEHPNQRLFAFYVVPRFAKDEQQKAELWSRLVDDPDTRVRQAMMQTLVYNVTPALDLPELIRTELASQDQERVKFAEQMVESLLFVANQDGPFKAKRTETIMELGPAAVPVLRKVRDREIPPTGPGSLTRAAYADPRQYDELLEHQKKLRVAAGEMLDAIRKATGSKKPDESEAK